MRWLPVCCFVLLVGAGATFVFAQRERTTKTSAAKRATRRQPMALTPAREAAAYTFAKHNHPELAGLLDRLKGRKNRAAYKRAMRQLYLDSERLARMKDSGRNAGTKRYQFSLKLWKLDSRIRLLAAQVYIPDKPNPKRKAELDKLLVERVELRIEQMEFDRDRMLQRLKKMNEQISVLKDDRGKAAESQLQRVKRSLGLRSPRQRTKKQPATPRK